MTSVLITGSRNHQDETFIWNRLDALRKFVGDFTLIEGGAPGTDRIGRHWAEARGQNYVTITPKFDRYSSREAPRIRNQEMVDLGPDYCYAFPLPDSRGTWDCINKARRAGIPVTICESSALAGGR